jgi:UDP-3-O-[3-hydroxymyristoyl] glucosamine N-acyltransferase
VIIQPGAVLGSDGYGFSTQDGKHHKIPQIGKVVIEDDVEVGANVTIDRATTGETRVGAGTKIDNLVHIAHNVQIGKNCLIVAQVGISGSTRIGNQVTLAGQVGVIGHITIGDGATIAAQSGVASAVEPGVTLWGTPARPIQDMKKIYILRKSTSSWVNYKRCMTF